MKLIPISERPDSAKILYDLLAEREPSASISHKNMPTWEEHLAFVAKKTNWASLGAYQDWCLIEEWCCLENSCKDIIVGAVYMTDRCEIGVSIFRKWQGGGLAPRAVKLLMEKYGAQRYVANIAPGNEASRKMFEKLGFKTVQHTLALEAE